MFTERWQPRTKAVTRIYFRGCWGTTQHIARMAEARRAEEGVWFLGRTRRAPCPPARGLRECCKLPQWGPGRSPGRNRFWCISKFVEGIKQSLRGYPVVTFENLVTNSRSVHPLVTALRGGIKRYRLSIHPSVCFMAQLP